MIIPALGNTLLGNVVPNSAIDSNPQRAWALGYIRDNVGSAIYWARRPEKQGQSAIEMFTISHTPRYSLDREVEATQPVIQLSVFTKGRPPLVCQQIADACRIVFSNYRGYLYDPNQNKIYVHGLTLVSEQMNPAQFPVESGEYWAFATGFDFSITYDRFTVGEECYGVHR